jgi:hypothetical protein
MVALKASFLALTLAGVANAVIGSIKPRSSPFKVTKNSKLPVTFTTHDSPTNA